MILVSDTSPICYLLLIDQIAILPILYTSVTIPQTVADELGAEGSPLVVKHWIAQPPDWLKIEPIETPLEIESIKLDPGEQAAIVLAEQLQADLIVLDDKTARRMALDRGLRVIGLLGIMKDAARAGLLDLEPTFVQLRAVGFWVAPGLLEQLLVDRPV
jgi:predicted nucleic acid-binding protein